MLFACAIFLAGSVTCVGSRRSRLRKVNGISGAHEARMAREFLLLSSSSCALVLPNPLPGARVSAVYLSF